MAAKGPAGSRVEFALRFPIDEVPSWAARYRYLGPETERLETVVGPRSREAGVITKPDFLAICEWKSVRQRPRYAENSAELIEEATRIALSARDERIRIGVLLPLRGVGWPVASTLLYFAHRDPYPILDFRALWSLGVDKPPFVFDFAYWSAYLATCRGIADDAGVSVRELDRALWQYSKEHQVRDGSPAPRTPGRRWQDPAKRTGDLRSGARGPSGNIDAVNATEVMAFESSAAAEEALGALGIEADHIRSGDWIATVRLPDDLASLEAALLRDDVPESAKILAGTLIALAPGNSVGGLFTFSVAVPHDHAAGATQNGE